MQVEELYHWLMTVVDSLPLESKYKDQAFKAALDYVAVGFSVRVDIACSYFHLSGCIGLRLRTQCSYD